MRLSSILEATVKWSGPLDNTLGDGSDWSVNYGTSDKNRPPMLYIKAPMGMIRSAIRHVAKSLLIWSGNTASGDYLDVSEMPKNRIKGIIDKITKADPNTEIYLFPELTHVGESHITISMGAELDGVFKNFGSNILNSVKVDGVPLFDDGVGIKASYDIDHKKFYSVYRAPFYKDSDDPYGPMLVALNISTDLYPKIRVALGLEPYFMINGSIPWSPHITLGYIPVGNNILDVWKKSI